MALHKKVYDLCKEYLHIPDKKIAELGAQYVMGEEWGSYGPPYFKDVFNGLDITSFDITGENNSIILNLSDENIDESYLNSFDIITNFGTTEHVQNQYNCWKNIFKMLKKDGIIISEIPKIGNWPNHCKYYFDENSFKALNLDFQILDIKDVFWDSNGYNIYSVMSKKHDGNFKTEENYFLSQIDIKENYHDGQGA